MCLAGSRSDRRHESPKARVATRVSVSLSCLALRIDGLVFLLPSPHDRIEADPEAGIPSRAIGIPYPCLVELAGLLDDTLRLPDRDPRQRVKKGWFLASFGNCFLQRHIAHRRGGPFVAIRISATAQQSMVPP